MAVNDIPAPFIRAFKEPPAIYVDGDPSKAPNRCPYEIEITPDGSEIYCFHHNSPSVGLPFGRKR